MNTTVLKAVKLVDHTRMGNMTVSMNFEEMLRINIYTNESTVVKIVK